MVTRRGMTVVEILIVVVLFVLVAGMAAHTYFQGVQVEKRLGAKLDLISQAQIATLRFSTELRFATEIFSPALGLGKTRPHLIFSNDLNQMIVIYVNDRNQLIRLNRNESDQETVIGRGVNRMRIYRKARRLVNYHFRFASENGKETLDLISGITIRNNFN